MNASLAERAMRLFEDLYDLEENARAEAVRDACKSDEALRRELERLLEHSSGVEILRPGQAEDATPLVFTQRSGERYQLLDEIGRGGMGIVYRAVDAQLNRTVAIKVMRSTELGARSLRRFSAEAQIAASLQHPGVAPVYDAGKLSDGRPFLAMKLVEGRTLRSLLADRSDREEYRALLIDAFESLCQVVAYAHSREVLHRDLKPDNVMVGEFGQVQVMDWGLAKTLADTCGTSMEEESTDLTASTPSPATSPVPSDTRLGEVMGTPAYMPPEQVIGQRGKQTDVFALGAILCEILTGHPPYSADSPAEVLSKSAKADLGEANRRLDDCGASVEWVRLAKQCLLPNPEQRPEDGAEVARRVSSHLQTVQTRLREADIANARSQTRAVEEVKRRRVKAMLLVTATLLIIVLLGVWGLRSHEETRRVRAEAIRRTDATERINRVTTESIRLRQAAEDSAVDDLAAWALAESSIRQAQSLLDHNVSAALTDEINTLALQIASQASDRKLLAKIERARERSLEPYTVPGEPEPSIRERRREQLAAVLRDTPLDPDLSSKTEALQFINSKELPVKEALIGAIDEWMVCCDASASQRWLSDTANAVDENTWRIDWREAVVESDVAKLRALLDSEVSVEQSPRSVLNLGCSVKHLAPGINTARVLRQVYRDHVEDFWLNCALGDLALERGSSHLAAQHYQYALGMRPIGSLHREIGRVFLATGWLDDAVHHLKRSLDLNDHSGECWELLAVTHLRLGRIDHAATAFERANALCANNLHRVSDYVEFLDRSGQRSKAIEYLRERLTDPGNKSAKLHRKLINLLYLDQRYPEAIQEFQRFNERQFADPMLCVTLSDAAIMAVDGHGKGSDLLTPDQHQELLLQANDWLRFALESWGARRTNLPVLREIVVRRDAGNFNTVFRQSAIAKLPAPQRAEWREFWSAVASEERKLTSFDVSTHDMAIWTDFEPERISSAVGATFERLPDGSFLVEGAAAERDVYTLTSKLDVAGIHAIRLDVIADERLPERGPGRHATGNFHLAEVEMWVEGDSSQSRLNQRLFDRAIASYSWQDRPIANAIDGDRHTLWHVWGQLGCSQTAKFYLDEALSSSDGQRLTIRLVHGGDGVTAPLGRFRISFQRRQQTDQH